METLRCSKNVSVVSGSSSSSTINTAHTDITSSGENLKFQDDEQQKFVPPVVEPGRGGNVDLHRNICDVQQATVISCLEKANISGGNCNDAFANWNHCLAKSYGYVPHQQHYKDDQNSS
jgi:hypothetical protein